jgi:hypothetical protein
MARKRAPVARNALIVLFGPSSFVLVLRLRGGFWTESATSL